MFVTIEIEALILMLLLSVPAWINFHRSPKRSELRYLIVGFKHQYLWR